ATIDHLHQDKIDLVVSDIRMPELSGFEFMDRFSELRPETPFIFITAYGNPDYALEAVRRNAIDYIVKPFKLDEVKETIGNAMEFVTARNERHRPGTEPDVSEHILGKSPVTRRLFGIVGRVAHASANVLITGESGTGKEMVARAIHNLGARRHKP